MAEPQPHATSGDEVEASWLDLTGPPISKWLRSGTIRPDSVYCAAKQINQRLHLENPKFVWFAVLVI
jgi:hypothetical protein